MSWEFTKSNKYKNRRTEYNGVMYDSKKEADVARELDIMVRAKEIREYKRQVTFNLYGINNGFICNHRVDFVITDNDGSKAVWEVKGLETKDWVIKKKLFEDNYPYMKYHVIK